MEETPKPAPFIAKPYKINNYTHLIALLKMKQAKYGEYTTSLVNTAFKNVLGTYKEHLDLDSVFEGFLHEKLRDNLLSFEESIMSNLNTSISEKIKEIKVENDHRVYLNKIGDVKDSEELLFLRPTQLTFKDELLYDLYQYISRKKTPLEFLNSSYLKFMLKYFNDNSVDNIKFDPNNLKDEILKKIVENFVKLRFNSEEYCIETYESRYLWAEVFVLFRIGRSDLALETINENEVYFELMTGKFKSIFSNFLNGKKSNYTYTSRYEDKFKKFLYELTDEKAKSDGLIISTADDYLWLKLVTGKEIKEDISEFGSSKIKFMIALLAKKYTKAIDILLKSEFDIVPKFFLLRELCLEQPIDMIENEISPITAEFNPQLKSRQLVDETSSTISLSFAQEQVPSTIPPVFLDFLFNLVSKMTTKERKVKLVEMLKGHSDYYQIIPIYVIKYDLFDILGKPKDAASTIDFSLDDKVAAKVLQILKEKAQKRKIIQLFSLIDDVSMIRFLIEAIEEAILVDESINTEIVEKYLKNKISKDSVLLEHVYGFYKFYKTPCVANLKTSVLLNQNIDLAPWKFIIEKIFPKAVEVVKEEGDKQMAKNLFKLCGLLDLNEECTSKISKDLVTLI